LEKRKKTKMLKVNSNQNSNKYKYLMKPRFKKAKKPNYKRGIVLAILLLVIIYLWMNIESITNVIFGVKP